MISSSNWLLLVSQGSAWCPSLLEKDLTSKSKRNVEDLYTLPDRSFDVIKRTKRDLKELIVCMHQPSITTPSAPPIPPCPQPFHQHLILEILHWKDTQRPCPTHWQVSELTRWPVSPQRKAWRALRPHQAQRLRSDKNTKPCFGFKTCLSLLFKAQKQKGACLQKGRSHLWAQTKSCFNKLPPTPHISKFA